MFYLSVWASVIFVAATCWGGGIGSGGANKLNKFVRKASSMVGIELESLEVVTEMRMTGKLKAIMESPAHLLYAELQKLKSMFSNRLLQPWASKR